MKRRFDCKLEVEQTIAVEFVGHLFVVERTLTIKPNLFHVCFLLHNIFVSISLTNNRFSVLCLCGMIKLCALNTPFLNKSYLRNGGATTYCCNMACHDASIATPLCRCLGHKVGRLCIQFEGA